MQSDAHTFVVGCYQLPIVFFFGCCLDVFQHLFAISFKVVGVDFKAYFLAFDRLLKVGDKVLEFFSLLAQAGCF